jgi:hypothetical protein
MKRLILLLGLLCACSTDRITSVVPAGLVANLDVPSTAVAGQNVLIRLALRNPSSNPVSLHMGIDNDLAFDPTITQANSKYVWSRLAGTNIAGEAGTTVVFPGDTVIFEATWDLRSKPDGIPVPAGLYTVEARILGDGDDMVVSGITSKIRVTR